MKKFEYKKIRGDELIGLNHKLYSKGDPNWDNMPKSDLEKEAGIATRDYTKYHNDKSVDEIIKYDFNKATEFALNELGDDGWELISIEKIKPQGFDVLKFGANKMYNFKRIKE